MLPGSSFHQFVGHYTGLSFDGRNHFGPTFTENFHQRRADANAYQKAD